MRPTARGKIEDDTSKGSFWNSSTKMGLGNNQSLVVYRAIPRAAVVLETTI
jgi:hypothetical protein